MSIPVVPPQPQKEIYLYNSCIRSEVTVQDFNSFLQECKEKFPNVSPPITIEEIEASAVYFGVHEDISIKLSFERKIENHNFESEMIHYLEQENKQREYFQKIEYELNKRAMQLKKQKCLRVLERSNDKTDRLMKAFQSGKISKDIFVQQTQILGRKMKEAQDFLDKDHLKE